MSFPPLTHAPVSFSRGSHVTSFPCHFTENHLVRRVSVKVLDCKQPRAMLANLNCKGIDGKAMGAYRIPGRGQSSRRRGRLSMENSVQVNIAAATGHLFSRPLRLPEHAAAQGKPAPPRHHLGTTGSRAETPGRDHLIGWDTCPSGQVVERKSSLFVILRNLTKVLSRDHFSQCFEQSRRLYVVRHHTGLRS